MAIGPKPSSDSRQWWNDPLEAGALRIPSNKKNPFEGDQAVKGNDGVSALSSRPAPAPPAHKKPAVDLLGGNNYAHQRAEITYILLHNGAIESSFIHHLFFENILQTWTATETSIYL